MFACWIKGKCATCRHLGREYTVHKEEQQQERRRDVLVCVCRIKSSICC